MATHDARVQEIEVLYHFASSLGRIGGDLAGCAGNLYGSAQQERGEFQSLLNRIQDGVEAAREAYADARAEWENAQADYHSYLQEMPEDARSREDLRSLRLRMDECREEVSRTRSALQDAESRYEEGLTIFNQVEALIMNIISLSQSFSQSVSGQIERAGDNVRLAAARLTEYLNS